MKVVVVESPAKAKTINKYLGSDFTVLASFGHIRDLPPKDGSVKPDDGFAMDWETDAKSERHIKDIAQAVKKADQLFLATDPDREGEAISWHVKKVLEERGALKGKDVKRVVFNEITKSAVLGAMKDPREIHQDLVDAYLARRALDYLVGFTLSPVLWRKLPGSKSAGRVQSVALRLICERETEIERFTTEEYWTIAADFLTPKGAMMTANLTHLNGAKLDKFGLPDEAAAMAAKAVIEKGQFAVSKVERKKSKRNPYAPFTTSTLQQEASRKLYMSAKQTMQLAQRLYEGVDIGGETVGLITYMRTDGVQMATEAIAAARDLIAKDFGRDFVPPQPRLYKAKAKNAQEAHECIRPTDLFRRPDQVARYLDREQLRLYELIWKRAIASQMASAELDQVAVDIADGGGAATFRANGSVVTFEGFLKVYREDRDDAQDSDDEDRMLPPVDENDAMARQNIRTDQHFTQPPPRFSEASLVKRMEELGIGRPSTYASILSVLQERNYVRLDARRFIPEDRGRLVTAFLEQYFRRYVEYNFTAELENQLDGVSDGEMDYRKVLESFWRDFSQSVEDTKELRISDVIEALDAELGPHFFPQTGEEGHDPRVCPTCQAGRLSLKLGKFGAFIGCSNYPECRYTRPLGIAGEGDAEIPMDGPKELGLDPETQEPVTLRKGPYGWYVQRGEAPKPKRVSLYKGLDPAQIDFELALKLLGLPREVGIHPETTKKITAGVGRFGPYLVHDGAYTSLKGDDDVLAIGMNRAMELISQSKAKKSKEPLKTLGELEGKPVTINEGRYGPYASCDGVHATLPKNSDPMAVSLEEAIELIKAKAAKSPAKPKRATRAKKAEGEDAPKKAAAKKAPAKKAAAKKAPAKKAEAESVDTDAEAKPVKKAAAKKPAAKKPAAPKKAAAKKAPAKGTEAE